MAGYKFVLEAVMAAIIATLLTGFYNSTPSQLVGAMWYGLPFTWIRYLVVGPQHNPWAVDYFGLVADLFVWTVIASVVISVAIKYRKKK